MVLGLGGFRVGIRCQQYRAVSFCAIVVLAVGLFHDGADGRSPGRPPNQASTGRALQAYARYFAGREDMKPSILAMLSAAGRAVIRGLAVVALVVMWSASHIGTYVLGVAGITTVALATTATPVDAGWRWRRWRRWGRRARGR